MARQHRAATATAGACGAELQAQRHCGLGGFGKRRWQIQAQAAQAGADHDLGHASAQRHGGLVTGRAAGVARQRSGHGAEFAGLAQTLGAGRALQAQHAGRGFDHGADGGRGRRRWRRQGRRGSRHSCGGGIGKAGQGAVHPHLAAQRLAHHAVDAKAAVGERDLSARARQARRARQHLHVIAQQIDAAAQSHARRVGQRKVELDLVVRCAVGRSAAQGVVQQIVDGRAVDHRQRVGQRAPALGADGHGGGTIQVVDLRLGALYRQAALARACAPQRAHVFERQRGAVQQQLAIELGKGRPGLAAFGHQTGRHIGVVAIGQIGRHPKLALLGLGKRKLAQIALEHKFGAARSAAAHRVAQVVAHVLVHA